MILTIRTDNPLAEVGLYNGKTQKAYEKWQAHRELSSTIHSTIKNLLDQENINWKDIKAIVYYEGPGSFTGLRIGASVANALSYANNALVVSSGGDDWIKNGLQKISEGKSEVALPKYGSEPHITKPKK